MICVINFGDFFNFIFFKLLLQLRISIHWGSERIQKLCYFLIRKYNWNTEIIMICACETSLLPLCSVRFLVPCSLTLKSFCYFCLPELFRGHSAPRNLVGGCFLQFCILPDALSEISLWTWRSCTELSVTSIYMCRWFFLTSCMWRWEN